MKLQYRTTLDVKASSEGQGFSGHASHFWSVDSYISAVAPGAFKKTIKERGDRILVMVNHNPDRVVGRATELKEDKTGLWFNARISDTTEGRDLMTLLRDDVPFGVSFSFNVIKSRPGTEDDPLDFSQYNAKPGDVEVLTEAKLYELGAVAYPANELADIASVRAMERSDYLTDILNAIRSDGDLDDEIEARAKQIIEAMEQRAAAGSTTALVDDAIDEALVLAERAKRNRQQIDTAIALSKRYAHITRI